MNRNCVAILPHTLPMITIIQASSLSTQTGLFGRTQTRQNAEGIYFIFQHNLPLILGDYWLGVSGH